MCVLLAKADSSFDAGGPKGARPKAKISDFEAYLLGKDAKQETSSETMVELPPKEISSLHTFNPIERWDSNQSTYWTLCLCALFMGEEARTLFKYLSVESTRMRRSGAGTSFG